ncbi:hypothetical protein Sta7437_4980 (plasmid) [Stanieria cyanosphaera PCC 7437]|uniref:Uncharacterized protein n=1 Tax=Stanieria cyanosphaera (strain ATCC 29371 / PCC 7437) TaxID=111780 RepID=K9Y0Q1_STAC7|nr:hypothetical protein [Stanieria cyanosphaera]AFZ38400.1 hypothetical protein Sta7437_4980 [Stanieria cyanosphaera PCC 7437]
MTNTEFLRTAVEISKILGVSDRTISYWATNEVIDKPGKAQYCLVSSFNYYYNSLLEQISSLDEKIEIANNKSSSKSLQLENMKQSIKVITANAKIREHELKILEDSLVNAKDADRVFAQARESFREMCLNMVEDISKDIAKMNDPNEIQAHLEISIRKLLSEFSVTC